MQHDTDDSTKINMKRGLLLVIAIITEDSCFTMERVSNLTESQVRDCYTLIKFYVNSLIDGNLDEQDLSFAAGRALLSEVKRITEN